MAKHIVIDWQRDSLIVASGTRRGGGIVFDQIRNLPLGEGEHGTVSAGQALRKAVQELGLGKAETIVIASREIVEVRTLSVPNVDADELPDIIRFQAQRQMANMGENWALDFILLPSTGLENKVALAGAISPAHLAEIEGAVNGAGLQLTQVVLRPIEIARFALSTDATGSMKEGASVVLCLTDQQSDLLLLASGAVAQLRSTRLPADAAQVSGTIIGEIKRSLVAASSQLNGQSLSSALLIAPAELAGQVEGAIASSIGCKVAVIDPRVMLPSGYDQAEELTHSASNRLAAIAGVIGSPSPDKRTLIDFKNPKKRAPKEVNYARYVLAAAAGLLLLFAGGAWWYSANSALDEELARLKKEIADNKDMGDLAKKQISEFQEVKSFLDASPNWVDELQRIAITKPDTEKVIMYSPTFSVDAKGVGKIQSKVYGVSPSAISDFESNLRANDQFQVNSSGPLNTGAWKEYPWETTTTITVSGRGWNLLADKPKQASLDSKLTEPPSADKPAVESEKAQPKEKSPENPTSPEDKDKPSGDKVATTGR